MSETIEIESTNESFKNATWPPTEDQIMDIVSSALNQSQDKDVKVLVYWDNPKLMILDPIHFAQTDYVRKKYTHNERSVEVNVGRQD